MAVTASLPTPRHSGLRRAFVTFLFAAAILGGAFMGAFLAYGREDLPQVSSLENFEPNVITQVYAADGSILGEFAIEKRVIVTFRDIPPTLRNAIVAVEDADFWKHLGINPWRIPGAAIANFRTGRKDQGFSTLTMQLSRLPLPDAGEDLRPEAQGDHPRLPDREELHEGGDLRALLQPGLLRPRELRRRGGQRVLLQQADQGA